MGPDSVVELAVSDVFDSVVRLTVFIAVSRFIIVVAVEKFAPSAATGSIIVLGVGSLKEGFVEYSIDSSNVAPVVVYSNVDGGFGQQKRASKSAHSVLLIFKSFKQRNLKLRLLKISKDV